MRNYWIFRPESNSLRFDQVWATVSFLTSRNSGSWVSQILSSPTRQQNVLPHQMPATPLSFLSFTLLFGLSPSDHWSNSLLLWVSVDLSLFWAQCEAQGENWSSPVASCHWCWRDWVYRSKWAFVSRWCWPAIGSCRPKCCIPIAWETSSIMEFLLGFTTWIL